MQAATWTGRGGGAGVIEHERALKSLIPSSWQVGLVGYGEVGRILAEDLRAVTVADIGLTPHSAAGTAERQAWVADLADSGLFGARGTADFARSPNWRTDADRI